MISLITIFTLITVQYINMLKLYFQSITLGAGHIFYILCVIFFRNKIVTKPDTESRIRSGQHVLWKAFNHKLWYMYPFNLCISLERLLTTKRCLSIYILINILFWPYFNIPFLLHSGRQHFFGPSNSGVQLHEFTFNKLPSLHISVKPQRLNTANKMHY